MSRELIPRHEKNGKSYHIIAFPYCYAADTEKSARQLVPFLQALSALPVNGLRIPIPKIHRTNHEAPSSTLLQTIEKSPAPGASAPAQENLLNPLRLRDRTGRIGQEDFHQFHRRIAQPLVLPAHPRRSAQRTNHHRPPSIMASRVGPRSVKDATRFTSTIPHAVSKSAGASAAAGAPKPASRIPGETPEERVRRLRQAHLAAQQAQVSQTDRVLGVSRRVLDAAHRWTVGGVILFTGSSSLLAA